MYISMDRYFYTHVYYRYKIKEIHISIDEYIYIYISIDTCISGTIFRRVGLQPFQVPPQRDVEADQRLQTVQEVQDMLTYLEERLPLQTITFYGCHHIEH